MNDGGVVLVPEKDGGTAHHSAVLVGVNGKLVRPNDACRHPTSSLSTPRY